MSVYLAMWDMYGLEYLENVTEFEKKVTWHILRGEEPPAFPLFQLEMRARYNSQRHYEIYSFNVEEHITKKDVEVMFAENPQVIVDWIRENGKKLFSDRADTTKQVIA